MSYPPAKGQPILVECEGGEAEPNVPRVVLGGVAVGFCRMCGQEAVLTDEGQIPSHVRDDILARLERGDFD